MAYFGGGSKGPGHYTFLIGLNNQAIDTREGRVWAQQLIVRPDGAWQSPNIAPGPMLQPADLANPVGMNHVSARERDEYALWLRYEGAFSGTATLIVRGAPRNADFNRLDRQLAAHIPVLVAPNPFGSPGGGTFVQGIYTPVTVGGAQTNGCAPLLVLSAILLLMALVSGGARTFDVPARTSPAPQPPRRASPSGYDGQPQPSSAMSLEPILARVVPSAVQPQLQPQVQPQPLGIRAPVLQTAGQCIPTTTCPGQCPVAPFCNGGLPFKGVCDPVSGMQVYYMPGQPAYVDALVGLYAGDGYFCTFNEAVADGFDFAP